MLFTGTGAPSVHGSSLAPFQGTVFPALGYKEDRRTDFSLDSGPRLTRECRTPAHPLDEPHPRPRCKWCTGLWHSLGTARYFCTNRIKSWALSLLHLSFASGTSLVQSLWKRSSSKPPPLIPRFFWVRVRCDCFALGLYTGFLKYSCLFFFFFFYFCHMLPWWHCLRERVFGQFPWQCWKVPLHPPLLSCCSNSCAARYRWIPSVFHLTTSHIPPSGACVLSLHPVSSGCLFDLSPCLLPAKPNTSSVSHCWVLHCFFIPVILCAVSRLTSSPSHRGSFGPFLVLACW